jgi:hypothetical protein
MILLAGAFATVWVLRYNPTDAVNDPLGNCLWHAVFGFNGPGCGATRAFWFLLHGNLLRAIQFHLPFVLVVPVAMYAWVQWALVNTTGTSWPSLGVKRWHVVAFGVFWILWTVVRNLVPWLDIPNMFG